MVDIKQQELIEARQKVGLYSIQELCSMFCCGRSKIDFAINSGQLKYMSPNNRDRFVYLNDFLDYMNSHNKKKGDV